MNKVYIFLTVLCALQIILAWICAPHSCEWGNQTYFYGGVVLLIGCFFVPFLQHSWSTGKQVGMGFLFTILSVVTWLAWFMIFNFRIMCRLF